MEENYYQQVTYAEDEQFTRLELFVSCRNLVDLDLISTTDSFLVVRIADGNRPPRKILQTKIYYNNLNPNYVETVYHSQKPAKLVGKVQATVSQIFGAPDNGVIKTLRNQQNQERGQIMMRFQTVDRQQNCFVTMTIGARDLPKTCEFFDFNICKPNVGFKIHRKKRDNTDQYVEERQIIQHCTNPTFRPFQISARKLCLNNEEHEFYISFFDHDKYFGKHKHIGTAKLTLAQLTNRRNSFDIMKDGERQGVCDITNYIQKIKYKFGEFIEKGLELNLVACIDFTVSNHHQSQPESLHFIPQGGSSQYEKALFQVSKILLDYDYDKLVPMYGFGARLRHPNEMRMHMINPQNIKPGQVNHCFPLNFNPFNPEVQHIQGIMKTYRQALPHLEFRGPTHFSELLEHAIKQAQEMKQHNRNYMILLILTDGQINDEKDVVKQIIDCCSLPISLVIVGIGRGDFTAMHRLDDDNCQLVDYLGRRTTRDCVQFLQFNEVKNDSMALACKVLQEIPRQIEEYFENAEITPNQIVNARSNPEIRDFRNNFNRPEDVAPLYANNRMQRAPVANHNQDQSQ